MVHVTSQRPPSCRGTNHPEGNASSAPMRVSQGSRAPPGPGWELSVPRAQEHAAVKTGPQGPVDWAALPVATAVQT